jgi:outer membrane protein W
MNDTGKGGKNYEKKSAKKLQGQLTSGSGAKDKKGDLLFGNLLLELKSSTHESITLKKEYLQKIRKAAIEQNKQPGLLFSFVTMNGVAEEEWLCIPLYLWRYINEDKT